MSDFQPKTSTNEKDDEFIQSLSPAELVEHTMHAIKKPKENRDEKDIKILMKFTENNKWFKNINEIQGEGIHPKLCQNLDYSFSQAGETIFEAGSFGPTFYVILIGSVNVFPSNGNILNNQEETSIVEIGQGDSFGEIALVDSVLRPRAVTVVTKEDCHFLVLERPVYKQILGDHQKEMQDETIDFLMQNPLFSIWSPYALRSWISLFKRKEVFKRNAFVYKEGDKADDVYLVRSGQVICTKVLTIHERNKDNESLVLDEENNVVAVARESTIKSAEIMVVTPGQLFGEEESYANYRAEMDFKKPKEEVKKKKKRIIENFIIKKTHEVPVRETSMVVGSATAEIWIVPGKVFFQKLQLNPTAMKLLTSIITLKTERRAERIEAIQQNSADYVRFLLTEPVGQRKIISAFSQSAPSPVRLDNNTEVSKEISDIMVKFGLIKNPNQANLSPNKGDPQSSQHVVEKRVQPVSKSMSPVKHRRQSSLASIPHENTKRLVTENRSPIRGSIVMDNSSLAASFTGSFKRFANDERSLEKSPQDNMSPEKMSPVKPIKKVYTRASTQIKLRVQDRLENGTYLSQNDRLYANVIRQYNLHRPDKILKSLKTKHEDYEDDYWKRREAAKEMATKQIDRLYQKKKIPSTEHVSTYKAEASQKSFMVEMTNLFQSRQNIVGPDGEPINVLVGAVKTHMRTESQPNLAKVPASPIIHTRKRTMSKEKDVIYVNDEKRPETERSIRTKSAMNTERGNKMLTRAQEVSVKKVEKNKSISFPKSDNIVMNYINEEIHKFRDNSDKESGLHTKSKLFNYSIWQIYGKRPRENAFLRMLLMKSKNKPEILANSPIKLVPRPQTSSNESSLILSDRQNRDQVLIKFKK